MENILSPMMIINLYLFHIQRKASKTVKITTMRVEIVRNTVACPSLSESGERDGKVICGIPVWGKCGVEPV